MTVSDILRDRMREPDGLHRMVVLSALLHGALLAGILLAPGRWLAGPADAPHTVMTISLGGGGDGPENGGFTSIGGRPVQEVAPPEVVRQAVRAPAAKAPEMTVPVRNAKPLKSASPTVKQAPDQARGRTPSKGAEVSEGTSLADTGARGQGFGLSTGGGPGMGTMLDVDFCCPDYIALMEQRIHGNWNTQAENAGSVKVRFTIERSGAIADPSVEQSSGVFTLDQNALRAIVLTKQLPALPQAFPNPTLTVHLTFQYTR